MHARPESWSNWQGCKEKIEPIHLCYDASKEKASAAMEAVQKPHNQEMVLGILKSIVNRSKNTH